MPPRAAQYPEQQAHSRISMSVSDWRQPQGLRGRPGFKPTCRAEFATWTASGQASVPVGGGRAWPGFETTRQANDQQPSAGGVEAAAGPAGPGRGAGGPRQGLAGLRDDAPSERSATKRRRCGGCRGACRAGLGAGGRRQGQGGLSDRTKHRPVGGSRGACRAWPGFETTRRAKLAARTASGRAGPAAAGDQAVPQAPPESQNSS